MASEEETQQEDTVQLREHDSNDESPARGRCLVRI